MKKLLAMGLSAVMLTSLAVPAMAAEGDVTNITNDKDRPIQFVDTGITELMTDEVEFYKKAIQSNDIFKNWVSLSYNIFESESKSSCDSDGEIWGQNWDELYGKEIGFMDYMLTSKQGVCGKYDNMWPTSTGLTVATSLAEVQYRAANAIAAEFEESFFTPTPRLTSWPTTT